MNQIQKDQIIKVSNELRKRGLYAEAGYLDKMITKEALLPAAVVPVAAAAPTFLGMGATAWGAIAAAVIGGGAATATGISVSKDAETIFQLMGVQDLYSNKVHYFEGEGVGTIELYINTLRKTDIIDGVGTFPVGHSGGARWTKKLFGLRHNEIIKRTEDAYETGATTVSISGLKIDEDMFQTSFEAAYGERASGIWQFGLDNENGWVDAWNTIVDIWKEQAEGGLKAKQKTKAPPEIKDSNIEGAPPPLPADIKYIYNGPSHPTAEASIAEIVKSVMADKKGRHLLWWTGETKWHHWTKIEAIKDPVDEAAAEAAAEEAAEVAMEEEAKKPQFGSLRDAVKGRERGDDVSIFDTEDSEGIADQPNLDGPSILD